MIKWTIENKRKFHLHKDFVVIINKSYNNRHDNNNKQKRTKFVYFGNEEKKVKMVKVLFIFH